MKNILKWARLIFFILAPASLHSGSVPASEESPQSFTFQGRLLNSAGTAPLTSVVSFTLGIYDPTGLCLLYQESQSSIDLSQTAGMYSISVGSATGASVRTANDPALSMATVFANTVGTPIRAPGVNCAGGYTPTAGDVRVLRVTVTPNGGSAVTLTPDLVMDSAPQANVAETLQGIGPTGFLQPNTSANLSQTTLQSLTSGSDASALHHHDSLYVKLSSASAQNIGSGGLYTSGSIGTGTLAPPTGTQLQIDTQSASTVGEAIQASGSQSADLFEIQNSSGTVISKFDSSGFLTLAGDPTTALEACTKQYVDNGLNSKQGVLTPSAPLQITGSVISINPSSGTGDGYLSSADWMAFNNKVNRAGDTMSGSLAMGANKISALADPTLAQDAATKNYVDTHVNGQTTLISGLANGQILKWNGTNWVNANPSTGSLTAVTATAPLASSGGNAPVISITQASSSSAGYLSASDWSNFNSAYSNSSGAQSANKVFASPDGASGAPSFRALVATDIPTLSGSQISGGIFGAVNASLLTHLNASAIASGVVPIGNLPVLGGDAGSGGASGLVPAPPAGSAASGEFLKADGTWALPPGTGFSQLTGDITAGPGSGSQAATISSGAVTNSKLANMGAFTLKGNSSASTTSPADLSIAQVSLMLSDITSLTGDVTTSGSGGAAAATVAKIQGRAIASTAPSNGQALLWNASNNDWEPANLSAGTITSVSASAPLSSSGGSAPVISIAQASSTASGYLSLGDWTNFNSAYSTTSTSQAANKFFASPTGSAGAPSFRSLVAADLPSLSATYLPLVGGTLSGVLAMGSNKITGLATPTAATDASTKSYSDSNFNGQAISISSLTSGQSMQWNGTNWINYTPLTSSSAVTSFNTRTGAVTLSSADITSALTYTPLNKSGDTMSGALAMGANKISNLADPALAQDAATKSYVDSHLNGQSTSISGLTSGQVLQWNGTNWVNIAPSAGTVTGVSASAPLASSGGTTPSLSIAQATSVSNGYLSSGDWTNFNSAYSITSGSQTANKIFASPNGAAGAPSFRALVAADIPSLSGSYLPLGGGTLTGTLNVPANGLVAGTNQLVLTGGYVGIGNASPAALLDVGGEVRLGNTSLACSSTTAGATRYNSTSKTTEFCNGSSWVGGPGSDTTNNIQESLSAYSIAAQTGSSGTALVYTASGAPSITLGAGTWIIQGAASITTSDISDSLELDIYNSTDSVVVARNPAAASTSILTCQIANTYGTLVVASGTKTIRLMIQPNGSSTPKFCASGSGAHSASIHVTRVN